MYFEPDLRVLPILPLVEGHLSRFAASKYRGRPGTSPDDVVALFNVAVIQSNLVLLEFVVISNWVDT